MAVGLVLFVISVAIMVLVVRTVQSNLPRG
jgi:hypothetical protein